jgi:uncharacterized protein YggE
MKRHLLFFIFILSLGQCLAQEESIVPTLTIQGTGIVKKRADVFYVSIGVTIENENVKTALTQNSEKMRSIIDVLFKLQIKESDIETDQFSIVPLWTTPDHNKQQTPSIRAYSVTNTLNVRVKEISQVGMLIDAVSEAGANTVTDLHFDLKDRMLLRQEAIRKAAETAQTEATLLAEALGMRIKNIHTISLDPSPIDSPYYMKSRTLYAAETTPIEAKEISISATVSISYEIEKTAL